MGINFPASPLVGDIWPNPAVAGQGQYTWDGEKWTAGATPASRASIYAAPFDAMAYNGMQINGSMEVSQENGTTGVLGSARNLDGWNTGFAGTGVIASVQHTAVPNNCFSKSLSVSAGATPPSTGASDFVVIQQTIEGYRCSRLGFGSGSAQPFTIGFWILTSYTGTMSIAVRNKDLNRVYVTKVTTTSGAWEYKTVTVPPDTTGTWLKDNQAGLLISFCAICGTGSLMTSTVDAWQAGNFLAATGQTNYLPASNNAVYITGVVVIPGIEAPSAARSPLIMRPYDQELVTCKRYWQSFIYPTMLTFAGYGSAGSQKTAAFVLSTEMRSAPTTTAIVGSWAVGNCSQPVNFNSSARTLALATTVTATGDYSCNTNSSGAGVTLDARL